MIPVYIDLCPETKSPDLDLQEFMVAESESSNVSFLLPIAQYYHSLVPPSWVEGMRGAGVYVEYVDAYASVDIVGWVNVRE